MPGPLSPDLQDFGERLREAAERQVELERREARGRSRRSRLRRRTVIGAVLAVLLPAGAIAGAGALPSRDGEPVKGDDRLNESLRPATDPSVALGSAVADPVGGPPWALRVASNARGEECFSLGRLRDGRLGRQDRDGFRPFPRNVPLTCGDLAKEGVVLMAGTQVDPQPRTYFYGISAGRAPVVLELGGRRYEARPKALGTFIFVFEGVRKVPGSEIRTVVDGRPFRVRY